jgi:sarcosine oxidase, subunit gamma
MAEPAPMRHTLAIPAVPELRLLPPAARFILRANARVVCAAGRAAGIELDETFCRAFQGGGRAALWLGPDEYLLLASEEDAHALAGALESALQGEAHALVDVSHRQTALEVQGRQATELLSSGCPLDLDLSAFPVGMCTRTVFARAEIILWRTAAEVFRIEVWRSFTEYVARLLAEAARESAGAAHELQRPSRG